MARRLLILRLMTKSLILVFILGLLGCAREQNNAAPLTEQPPAVAARPANMSRVNDARSAQQIGALVILPISGLLVAQITGNVVMTPSVIGAIAVVLLALNAVLLRVGIALFDRESILTRWK